jgi:hypothetical protein
LPTHWQWYSLWVSCLPLRNIFKRAVGLKCRPDWNGVVQSEVGNKVFAASHPSFVSTVIYSIANLILQKFIESQTILLTNIINNTDITLHRVINYFYSYLFQHTTPYSSWPNGWQSCIIFGWYQVPILARRMPVLTNACVGFPQYIRKVPEWYLNLDNDHFFHTISKSLFTTYLVIRPMLLSC